MITATVRYKLPPNIDYAACREHFHKIAPGFRQVKGLISKHFIWNESSWAGGVYQWETLEDARAFYSGSWLDGIVERYGMHPQIEFYEPTTHAGRWSCSRIRCCGRPAVVLERSALIKLLGTSLLAGIARGLFAAIAAHALGLSMAIAGGVPGTLAAIVVAVVIVRHGPTA